MEGTPHSLKFEVLAQPEAEEAEAPVEEPVVETEAELSQVDETPEAIEEEFEDAMDNIEELMSFEDMDL